MPPSKAVEDSVLEAILEDLRLKNPGVAIKAWQIKDELLKIHNEHLDESTIRQRFISMGKPLGGISNHQKEEIIDSRPSVDDLKPIVEADEIVEYPEELKSYIPTEKDIEGYLERDVDKRLAIHYETRRHPITQGPQGTGKTFSHMFYAFRKKVPFMLISCFQDMMLHKFFGDKTLKDGTIVFREGILVKMIQHPSVILFDEINAVDNAKSYDFHALLQNRELFVKDGNDGHGKIYKLHPKCRIGFAQNPRSAKYIGGTVKPSSFLGRCSYITFDGFTKDEIIKIINLKYPKLDKKQAIAFTDFFFEANNYLNTNSISVDISIRQLESVIEFYLAGMSLKDAINDGMINVLDAISNPAAKSGMYAVARTIFHELNEKKPDEDKVSKLKEKLASQIASSFTQQQAVYTMAPTAQPGRYQGGAPSKP